MLHEIVEDRSWRWLGDSRPDRSGSRGYIMFASMKQYRCVGIFASYREACVVEGTRGEGQEAGISMANYTRTERGDREA